MLERPHQSEESFDAVDAGVALRTFDAGVGEVEISNAPEQVQMFAKLERRAQTRAGDEIEIGAAAGTRPVASTGPKEASMKRVERSN